MKRQLFCASGSTAGRPDRRAPGTAAWAALLALLAPAALPAAQEPPSPELRARVRAALASADSFEDKFDAQVWLTDMASRLGNQVPDPELRVEILTTAHQEAKRAELPVEMVLAVIDIESAFDPYALSSAGAQGLMQVMPFWREELGPRRLIGVRENIVTGCAILRYYYDKEKGDWTRALARYNGSVGQTWYSQRVLDRLRTRWYRQ
ncbi:MAG: lytic transglycosylase domain-containing protein [Gammaproteobacteria bacterium]|jgi:soluble lytic murein transglycosylase-like protein|nr:lytic transglycosylase domain-containing protein [Gammaproteobacteria bacterium]